jgi:hypothetical protein
MLQSLGALIRIETSSSADAYGLLTRNTALGEEEGVRCEPPPTGRPREHDAVTRGTWRHIVCLIHTAPPPDCLLPRTGRETMAVKRSPRGVKSASSSSTVQNPDARPLLQALSPVVVHL